MEPSKELEQLSESKLSSDDATENAITESSKSLWDIDPEYGKELTNKLRKEESIICRIVHLDE